MTMTPTTLIASSIAKNMAMRSSVFWVQFSDLHVATKPTEYYSPHGTSAGFEPAPGLPGRHLGEVVPKTQKTTVEHSDLWG